MMKKTFAFAVLSLALGLAACSSESGYQGGGRGAPVTGGGDPAVEDDLGGTEVPPDPAFDEDTEDPPADPE